MNSFIDGEAMKLTELLVPWIAILFSIMIAFWLKDFAQNFMIGLKFRMNTAFNEGDKVILDGHDAIIVKIGLRDTVFGVNTDRGYTWRYVPNVKIPNLKLEKIINSDFSTLKKKYFDLQPAHVQNYDDESLEKVNEKVTHWRDDVNELRKFMLIFFDFTKF